MQQFDAVYWRLCHSLQCYGILLRVLAFVSCLLGCCAVVVQHKALCTFYSIGCASGTTAESTVYSEG